MFNHLMSRGHRQEFVEHLYKSRPWPFPDIVLSRSQLLEIAIANAENNGNLGERIKTRRSDEVVLERISFSLKDKVSGVSSLASRQGSLDPGKGRQWLHS